MKKLVSIISVLAMSLILALSLCSCSTEECDFCGVAKNSADMRKSEVDGNTYYMCDDCYHELEESIFETEETHAH